MAEDAREKDANEDEPTPKRLKLEDTALEETKVERRKGVALIKAEYLVATDGTKAAGHVVDDDAAEAAPKNQPDGKREKQRGQNKGRKFFKTHDSQGLCGTRTTQPEFSPLECRYGDNCRFEHDLRKYLQDHKRKDLSNFGGKCPVWEAIGTCQVGWRCRFVGSHMEEHELPDGRRELRLVQKSEAENTTGQVHSFDRAQVVNVVDTKAKIALNRKKYSTPKSDRYIQWLHELEKQDVSATKAKDDRMHGETEGEENKSSASNEIQDQRAEFSEGPLLPSEKRRIYFGPQTPVLAPLTTQGNLPFRRLCVELGAQLTYSEMAMGLPLLQGHKGEWALIKAHKSEAQAPITPPSDFPIVEGYDNSRDLRFGAQIAGNKPWNVLKATEALTSLCPHLRVVDLNCGCPIDLVYRQGAGSALLDSPSKLEKILAGMNAVSGEVPITAKIRMGTKDSKPTAEKLVDRLTHGLGSRPSCGVAAITLHGRSRQQRYTRSADWEYIAECAAIVKRHRATGAAVTDTIRESDARYGPAGGHVYFLGNGDCYSHVDYQNHLQQAKVDSVMVARGALIKPWIFEEIATGQYLDKSASERLSLVEKYVRYGLETWGSDEVGVGHTRRFLLEWLSFTHRYVPLGILEYLPPNLQDRPPAWRGRNELETLLGSDNYKDWIKISDMFLGPAGEDFKFQPKHKSNSYEIEAEG